MLCIAWCVVVVVVHVDEEHTHTTKRTPVMYILLCMCSLWVWFFVHSVHVWVCARVPGHAWVCIVCCVWKDRCDCIM